jgi:salicylate hydroxylase
VTGDAGHATSPHHGSGAGFAIEDSAVMAEVLADEHVRAPQDIEVAFAAFDAIRRERDQWLVKSSRFLGDAYEGMVPEIRTDWEKIHHEMVQRHDKILSIDISKECERAKEDLHRRLA